MRFSQAIDGAAEAASIEINTRVYDLQRQGLDVLVLSLGEAFFDLPPFSAAELPFPESYHYSSSRGLPELRQTLAQYYTRQFDVPVNPETELLMTAGSKAALYMAFLSILDPGDEVLVPEPAWVSYSEQIKLCGGQSAGIPLGTSVFHFADFITPRTKAIVVNTPHNPTGYVYNRRELQHLLDLAEQHDLWLLCDEAYSEFVIDGSFVSLGTLDRAKRRTILFNSLSKNLGVSGWRLGYAIGGAPVIDRMLKVQQHLLTCPPTLLAHSVQQNFHALLDITRPQIFDVVAKRNLLQHYLEEIGLTCLPGFATFYLFVSIAPSGLTSAEFCTQLLDEHRVAAVPGSGYGKSCDRFVRVSVGTESFERCCEGLDQILRLIESTRRSVQLAA
jgi:aminotransferase